MLADSASFVRVQNIYNPENFERQLRPVARLLKEHSDKYKSLPSLEQVKAITGVTLTDIPEMNESYQDWFRDEFEGFTKRYELERAILKCADHLEKGEFDPVEKLIRDAVQISLLKDMGTDYFADPRARLEKYFNSGGQVSTGYPSLDRLLYGGFSRKELNIFVGGSGSGKSLCMMNIALNWVRHGLNGVYISMELSEELVGLRTDAMGAIMSTKDIRSDIESADLKVRILGKKSGSYQIKAIPAQSTVNEIRAYMKEYQIQSGKKIDFLMVDYMDLMMPASVKVDPSNAFVKDKYIAEELRNLAIETDVLLITASQLNRASTDEVEFNFSHIAGGISKVNTADNMFAIYAPPQLRERGQYQLQAIKTRNSNGVGQKIDMDYNPETMRISDPGTSTQTNVNFAPPASVSAVASQNQTQMGSRVASIMGQIKGVPPTEVATSTEKKYVTGSANSSVLNGLLGKLKTNTP